MNTSQLLSVLSLGAALILVPGTERVASADNDSHPVFGENPGKHKGWDKHDKDKDHDHNVAPIPPHRYEHVADARHEHLYPRTVTRTSTGYWHSHDGYPRHFHYYRTGHCPAAPARRSARGCRGRKTCPGVETGDSPRCKCDPRCAQ